jgi:trk system potassium uptake protein
MNYLVIGLGNFGSSLAIKLTQLGHEVIGVDQRMEKVEMFKDEITHTICLDSTDIHAAKNLPIDDTDAVIICIGENEGDSIMATALMKQLNVKRIISRSVSDLQETVIKAMGITEIVHPELDSAIRLANNLNTEEFIDSYELAENYSIVKARVPDKYAGKKLKELNLRKEFNLVILTTISSIRKSSVIGKSRELIHVREVADAETVLNRNEILVVYGHNKDIKRFLE